MNGEIQLLNAWNSHCHSKFIQQITLNWDKGRALAHTFSDTYLKWHLMPKHKILTLIISTTWFIHILNAIPRSAFVPLTKPMMSCCFCLHPPHTIRTIRICVGLCVRVSALKYGWYNIIIISIHFCENVMFI